MGDKSPYVMMGGNGPRNPAPPPKAPAVKFLPGANQKGFPSAGSKESKGSASKEQYEKQYEKPYEKQYENNRSPAAKTPVYGKSSESSEMPGSGSSKKSKEYAKPKLCNWLLIVFIVLFILALAGAITMTILFALKASETQCLVEIDILKVLQLKVDPNSRTASDEEMALACMMYESSTKCCLTKSHLEKTKPKIPSNSAGKTGFELLAGLKGQTGGSETMDSTTTDPPAAVVQSQQPQQQQKQQQKPPAPPPPPPRNHVQVPVHPPAPSNPSGGGVGLHQPYPHNSNPSRNNHPVPNPQTNFPSSHNGNRPLNPQNSNINSQNHNRRGQSVAVPVANSPSNQGGSQLLAPPNASKSNKQITADETSTAQTTEDTKSNEEVTSGIQNVI